MALRQLNPFPPGDIGPQGVIGNTGATGPAGQTGTYKITAGPVALGTRGTGETDFTWYTIPNIAARGFVSLLVVTASSAGSTYDIEVRGLASPTGVLLLQAISVDYVYLNPTPWYYETDNQTQNFYIGIRNTGGAVRSFEMTSLRMEKFA